MGALSDVLLHSASSTRRLNGDGEAIGDRILPACLVPSVPENLTSLPSTQTRVLWCLPEYHWSEVPGLEEMSEVPDAGDYHGHSADVEGECH